jgi:hypothetical protein
METMLKKIESMRNFRKLAGAGRTPFDNMTLCQLFHKLLRTSGVVLHDMDIEKCTFSYFS